MRLSVFFPAGHPPHHRPQTTTPPTPREPPRGPRAPREPVARSCRLSAARELSDTPGCAAPQEVAPAAVERLLCPANKNITYI
jgi:hypothetical protein